MPKKDKPPTAEEIAEMLGVAPEKTFKVDKEDMGKVGCPSHGARVCLVAPRAIADPWLAMGTERRGRLAPGSSGGYRLTLRNGGNASLMRRSGLARARLPNCARAVPVGFVWFLRSTAVCRSPRSPASKST